MALDRFCMFNLYSLLKLSCFTIRMLLLNMSFYWLDDFVSFLFHFLKQLLVIRKSLRLNDLFYLSLNSSSNNSVYCILLSMNVCPFWLFDVVVMNFRMKSKLVDWFLVLNFWWFFISLFLVGFLSCQFVEYLRSTISCLRVGHLFWNRIVCLLIVWFLMKLIIASLGHTSLMGSFTFRSTCS
jgi:hypothetical protein